MIGDFDFEDVTTDEMVEKFEAATPIFEGVIKEMRELSRKKPDSIMSAGKVRLCNRVLEDLLVIFKPEPSGKYLETLNEEMLPQVSDAVLIMVQFESAAKAFKSKYRQRVDGVVYWITKETLSDWSQSDEAE